MVEERERDLVDITRLLLEKKSRKEITAWLAANRSYKLSYEQVVYDVRTIRAGWRADTDRNIGALKSEALAELDHVQRQAWEAWHRSRQTEESESAETISGSSTSGQRTKQRLDRRGRDGNPQFLQVVMTCLQKRAELLGLNAPTHQVLSGPDGEAIPIQVEGRLTDEDIANSRRLLREKFIAEYTANPNATPSTTGSLN